MRCPKCPSDAFLWKPGVGVRHAYRVECKVCGTFVQWGAEDQCREDLSQNKGSELYVDPGIQDLDVSDLFR